MQSVPQIRVFLGSPGDVNEERAVAMEVLDMLEYDPLFRKGRGCLDPCCEFMFGTLGCPR